MYEFLALKPGRNINWVIVSALEVFYGSVSASCSTAWWHCLVCPKNLKLLIQRLISLICLWAHSRDIRPIDGTASCLPALSAPPNEPRVTPAVKRKDECAQEEQQKSGTEVGSMNTSSIVVSHRVMVQPYYTTVKWFAVCMAVERHSSIKGYDRLFMNLFFMCFHFGFHAMHTRETLEYFIKLFSYC